MSDENENSTSEPTAGAATSAPPPAGESQGSQDPLEQGSQDPLEVAKAEHAKLKDQLLRTLADFDNYRKRSRRELVDAEKRGREDVIKELLPVFDNLERAGAHAENATDMKALTDGLAMVLRHFGDTLGRLGLERVPALGRPFDPSMHEAVQQLETADFEPGTIAAEVQAGYKSGERLIRPALVVVAKAKPN